MYLIYSVLFSIGVVLLAPFYWWRKGRTMARGHWGERFGNLPFQEPQPGAIWVHAVSLGETLAVAGLVQEMQQAFGGRKIYLSHVTPTGREAGEKRLPSVAGRFYVPLDWRWTTRKAMARIRPSLLLVVETELWPNLLHSAREAGARVVIVNARLSEHSLRGYQRIRPFMRRVLADVDTICAQSAADADRFVNLGAEVSHVKVMGNLKFDAQPPKLDEFARSLKATLQQEERTPILVAASTMPGEEPLVLQAWDLIQKRYPKALLILAPRHPNRFEEVSQELARGEPNFVRRTALQVDNASIPELLASARILLLDTIGELAGIFELADVVFMGGTLVKTGGHNVLEPAYWAKAIVFGPSMENFRDIARLFLDAGAALQVSSPEELAEAAGLLENKDARDRMGAKARQVLEQNSGATSRTLEEIARFLHSDQPNSEGLKREVE